MAEEPIQDDENTYCPKCGQGYPKGTMHVCPRKKLLSGSRPGFPGRGPFFLFAWWLLFFRLGRAEF